MTDAVRHLDAGVRRHDELSLRLKHALRADEGARDLNHPERDIKIKRRSLVLQRQSAKRVIDVSALRFKLFHARFHDVFHQKRPDLGGVREHLRIDTVLRGFAPGFIL